MRKAYGPTGVSFNYTIAEFLRDAKKAPFDLETIVAGNPFISTLDLTKNTKSELTGLFNACDCMSMHDGKKTLSLFAG